METSLPRFFQRVQNAYCMCSICLIFYHTVAFFQFQFQTCFRPNFPSHRIECVFSIYIYIYTLQIPQRKWVKMAIDIYKNPPKNVSTSKKSHSPIICPSFSAFFKAPPLSPAPWPSPLWAPARCGAAPPPALWRCPRSCRRPRGPGRGRSSWRGRCLEKGDTPLVNYGKLTNGILW